MLQEIVLVSQDIIWPVLHLTMICRERLLKHSHVIFLSVCGSWAAQYAAGVRSETRMLGLTL